MCSTIYSIVYWLYVIIKEFIIMNNLLNVYCILW